MLNTTATFSPRLFKTNWRSFAMDAAPNALYSKLEGRAIEDSLERNEWKESLNWSLS